MASMLCPAQLWLASFQQPVQSFIENPFRRSVIPRFLLDARHPWILAHRGQLERLSNVQEFLCTEPVKEGVILEIPPDLFNRLEIDNSRYEVSRAGWPNAFERLAEMSHCSRALSQVKKLDIDIYVHKSHHSYTGLVLRLLEPSEPPAQLVELMGDVLESMINLESLNFDIPPKYTHIFEEAFKLRKLQLPSIKYLKSGPYCHYMVAMCPNLHTLSNGGSQTGWYNPDMPDENSHRYQWGIELIHSAALAPKLKRFSIPGGRDGWSTEFVWDVVNTMPQLESLGLYGSLGSNRYYNGDDTGDGEILKEFLEILTELKNLTHLDLSHSSNLGVGYVGGGGCGNVYLGKNGKRYRRQVVRRGAKATNRAGDIVIASLPYLNSFTIGGWCANITRDPEDGKMIAATWPWTGRMKEWLFEAEPDPEGNDWHLDEWDDEDRDLDIDLFEEDEETEEAEDEKEEEYHD